jgi:hypothetical protein
MNAYGWIFLSLSWALIMAFAVFCFMRVLREKDEDL